MVSLWLVFLQSVHKRPVPSILISYADIMQSIPRLQLLLSNARKFYVLQLYMRFFFLKKYANRAE